MTKESSYLGGAVSNLEFINTPGNCGVFVSTLCFKVLLKNSKNTSNLLSYNLYIHVNISDSFSSPLILPNLTFSPGIIDHYIGMKATNGYERHLIVKDMI